MPALNCEQMIAEAERATGLADWGGDDFREPLRILTTALNDEAELHAEGERIASRHLHDVLCGRLRMAEDRKRFPGIANEKIVAPVFVIGLPRAGTTFLHNLLTQDPNSRAPATWEIMYPSPPPERATWRDDARIAQCQAKLQDIGFLDEGLKAIHPFGAKRPEECNFIWNTRCARRTTWRGGTCRATPACSTKATCGRYTRRTGASCSTCSTATPVTAGCSRRRRTWPGSTPCLPSTPMLA